MVAQEVELELRAAWQDLARAEAGHRARLEAAEAAVQETCHSAQARRYGVACWCLRDYCKQAQLLLSKNAVTPHRTRHACSGVPGSVVVLQVCASHQKGLSTGNALAVWLA